MAGFIDLHCHWIPGVDDGARNVEEAVAILRALAKLGFERVIATPHMRPGLFDNNAGDLRAAFDGVEARLVGLAELPERGLSSEHFFDELVFERLCTGQGLPYPGGSSVLLEFHGSTFPPQVEQLLSLLRRRGLVPVVAHPERYQALWERPEILERLCDQGAFALLDVAALAGKYGRAPQRCAESFLERGAYHAACSDAHRPEDVALVARGMRWLAERHGQAELQALFRDGPLQILGETPHMEPAAELVPLPPRTKPLL
jgi:protein-tyrosine phosphatase